MAQEYLSTLSADGQELLRLRLSGRGTLVATPGSGASADDRIPVSLAQRRLWFLSEADPDMLAYHVDVGYRISGALDRTAFTAAVGELVGRHDALRTRFRVADGQPWQVVVDPEQTGDPVSWHDFSGLADPDGRATELAVRMADTPFDRTGGPLFRAWVARLREHEHVFGICVHHLVFDRDSLDVLVAELSESYARRVRDEPPTAPTTPTTVVSRSSYADFARWQTGRAAVDTFARQRAYWRDRLRTAPVLLDLPTDRPRPDTPSHVAGAAPVTVDAGTTARLRTLAAAHGTTLFTAALAGFQGLLARHCGLDTPVVVGCGFNGRGRIEFEGVLGFFANSLPILADLAPNPPFTAMVDAAREAMLGAHENQDLPFDEIVRELAPPRDLRHNPIFQVWFDLASSTGEDTGGGPRLPGCRVEPFHTGHQRTRFDLELHLTDTPSAGLGGRLLYATDLFDADTAAELVARYQRLLTEVATDPHQRLARIPMLDRAELSVILDSWGAAR